MKFAGKYLTSCRHKSLLLRHSGDGFRGRFQEYSISLESFIRNQKPLFAQQ